MLASSATMDEMLPFATRLLAALALGAAIGVERQWRQRLAGLQTNALVALGAAGFVAFSQMLTGDASPSRMAAQVVSGIGFLGAGVIFKDGFGVRGLNTAATLWCSAAVGVMCGAGFLPHAALLALLVVAVNLLLKPAARMLAAAAAVPEAARFAVTVTCLAAQEARLRALLLNLLQGAGMVLHALDSEDAPAGRVTIAATLAADARATEALEQAVGALSLDPAVGAARWRRLEED